MVATVVTPFSWCGKTITEQPVGTLLIDAVTIRNPLTREVRNYDCDQYYLTKNLLEFPDHQLLLEYRVHDTTVYWRYTLKNRDPDNHSQWELSVLSPTYYTNNDIKTKPITGRDEYVSKQNEPAWYDAAIANLPEPAICVRRQILTNHVPAITYLTINDVCSLLSISRRTLERMRDHANSTPFPAPDLWIGRSPRWDRDLLIDKLKIVGKELCNYAENRAVDETASR